MKLTYNQLMAISTAWACAAIVIGFSVFAALAPAFPLELLGPTIGIIWCFLSIPVFPRISQDFLLPEYRKPEKR